MDIQNYGYPQLGIMDIHNRSYGYAHIELWISTNRIMDIHDSNYGYP